MLKLGRYWPWKTVWSHFHMRVRPMLLHRPSFLFDCFVKIWANCKNFWANGLPPPPPPLAKNSPYAYVCRYNTSPLMNLLLLSSLPSLAPCFQPRSTFCLTARAHLNTQKYGTGCFAVCYMYLQMCNLKPRWLERPRQLELNFLSLDQNLPKFTPISRIIRYFELYFVPLQSSSYRGSTVFQAASAYLVSLECRRLILRTII